MPWDFSGDSSGNVGPIAEHHHNGFWSGLGHFFGSAWKDTRQFFSSIPHMPSQMQHDAARAVNFFMPAPRYAASDPRSKSWWNQPSDPKMGPTSFHDYMSKVRSEGVWKPTLEMPLIDLVPGTQTAKAVLGGRKALGEQLGQHPVSTIFDVLPYAEKGIHVATEGTPLAEEAAKGAEAEGKAGKAAKMVKEGLTGPQALKTLAKRGGRYVEGRFPTLHNTRLSIAEAGIGGSTLHHMMRLLGEAKGSFETHLAPILSSIGEVHKSYGLSLDDVERLTKRGVYPSEIGWKEKLTPNERAYVEWSQTEMEHLADLDPRSGKSIDGERYSMQEVRRLRSIDKGIENKVKQMERAQEAIRSYDEKGNIEARTKAYRDAIRYADQIERLKLTRNRVVPARFKPMIVEMIKPYELKLLEARTDPSNWEHVQELVKHDLWKDAGITKIERNELLKHFGSHWTKLRPYDPMYVHSVGEESVARIARPPLFDRVTTPDAWRSRSWDMRPWVENASVGVSAAWADYTRLVEQERFTGVMRDSGIAKTASEVREEAQRWAKAGAGKGSDLRARQDWLMGKYRAYDPRSLTPREAGVAGRESDLYIPKALADALEGMRPKASEMKFTRFWSGGVHLFRLSYLNFRPFYYVHVGLSGAVLALARGGPGELLSLPKSLELLRSGELPTELGVGYARMGSAEDFTTRGQGKLLSRMRSGSVLGDELLRRYDQMGDARAAFRKVERFTNSLASTMQDMWKATSYLAEKDRMVKAGYAQGDAVGLAVEHANRVFGNMNELLPWERAIQRSILPFYSWSKHILSYVSSFPFDHPWRAAIMDNVGRAVIEDWNAHHKDLPERFLHYFWLGQDKQGREMLFPASGLLPMMQAPDILTLAGFLARVDPRIKSALESMGVDLYTAGPDPFLPQTADPVKGIQKSVTPNIFGRMFSDMFGQTDPFFTSSDLKNYYQKNPDKRREAIMRAILGAAPMPKDLTAEQEKWIKTQQRVLRLQIKEAQRKQQQQQPAGAPSGGGGWQF